MEGFGYTILVYESQINCEQSIFVKKRKTWSKPDFSRLSERFGMNENIIL